MAEAAALRRSRKAYLRPLWVGIAFSMAGEAAVFVVFGVLLHPSGNLLVKLLWTVGFCGVGMGASYGAFLDLLVVGRWSGGKAVFASAALSTLLLGAACNVLCWRLDLGLHYFGGAEQPIRFLASGAIFAALGGLLAGMLLFTARGEALLDRWGL